MPFACVIPLSLVRVSLHSGYPEPVSIAKAFMKLHAKLSALRGKHTLFCHLTMAVPLLRLCELKETKQKPLLLLNSLCSNSWFAQQMGLLSRLCGEGTSRETGIVWKLLCAGSKYREGSGLCFLRSPAVLVNPVGGKYLSRYQAKYMPQKIVLPLSLSE